MKDYTNEDLIDYVGQEAYTFLLEHNIENQLAKETVYAFGYELNTHFERIDLENTIDLYLREKTKNKKDYEHAITILADRTAAMAAQSQYDVLEQNPILMHLNNSELEQLCNLAGSKIEARILKLL